MAAAYETKRYVIFDVSEMGQIDFSQVQETSSETVRKNVGGTKAFVKYEMPQPSSISALKTKSAEYTYHQILDILTGSEWADIRP